MKKVLALVLAVMMLATVAFAAYDVIPGKKIKLERDTDSGNALVVDGSFSGTFTVENNELDKALNSDNYSIGRIKYNEGKSLIDSIKLDDDDEQIVITFEQDYDNTKGKDFDVEFTVTGKGKGVRDLDVHIAGTVGYELSTVDLNDDEAYLSTVGDITSDIVEFKKGTVSYSTLVHDFGDEEELGLEVRVYDGNKFFLDCDTAADTDVLKANSDVDGDLYFYNFEGEPTFDATAKLYFYDATEDDYVYQIKDGKLVEVGSYSEDDGCWVVKTRTLGAYVMSSEKLSNASGEDTTEEVDNPDTGANDVVGIAAALGAVALVSAAAVSLKK
jgi:hypothetical protein